MKQIHRGLLALALLSVGAAGLAVWHAVQEPSAATRLAMGQLEPGGGDPRDLLAWQSMHQWPVFLVEAFTAGVFAWWVWPYVRMIPAWARRRAPVARRLLPVLLVGLLAVGLPSCIKPYDKPEFIEIDTSETGFLIPLEGDTGQQARFASVDFLQERKVAAKRVQITHRWNQEGRLSSTGHWVPTVRLVKVNRSPLTRSWTAMDKSGNGTAIWIESADSVGFSMGFTCTAYIAETDAATFLYWYPSGSLTGVMDTEIRARIQQSAAEVAAKYPLDLLRARKQEIADTVKKDIVPFFEQRGITVTTIGMFGGMTYENPAIQKSIDETFIAQQLKVVSLAKFEAQQKENERIELEAEATAERQRREALGRADARMSEAKAEAEALRLVSQALHEAEQNPLLLQIRQIEVDKARVERWDGRMPTMMLGSEARNLLFTTPLPTSGTR